MSQPLPNRNCIRTAVISRQCSAINCAERFAISGTLRSRARSSISLCAASRSSRSFSIKVIALLRLAGPCHHQSRAQRVVNLHCLRAFTLRQNTDRRFAVAHREFPAVPFQSRQWRSLASSARVELSNRFNHLRYLCLRKKREREFAGLAPQCREPHTRGSRSSPTHENLARSALDLSRQVRRLTGSARSSFRPNHHATPWYCCGFPGYRKPVVIPASVANLDCDAVKPSQNLNGCYWRRAVLHPGIAARVACFPCSIRIGNSVPIVLIARCWPVAPVRIRPCRWRPGIAGIWRRNRRRTPVARWPDWSVRGCKESISFRLHPGHQLMTERTVRHHLTIVNSHLTNFSKKISNRGHDVR